MRTACALLWLVAASAGVSAQSPSIDRVNITNPGIYRIEVKSVIDDKKLAGHSWQVVTGMKVVRNTTSVPARLCTSFGFQYVIVGSPSKVEVPIKMVTRFPAPGLYNPETRERTFEHATVVRRTVGRVHFRSYTLESSWELVPGVWTFELWHKDRKLAEQSFTLTSPCADCEQDEPAGQPCEERLVATAAAESLGPIRADMDAVFQAKVTGDHGHHGQCPHGNCSHCCPSCLNAVANASLGVDYSSLIGVATIVQRYGLIEPLPLNAWLSQLLLRPPCAQA